jgi:multidrug transporter EmrE-like cation transporter
MHIATLGRKFALVLQALVLAFGFGAVSIAVTAVTSGTAYADCAPDGPSSADPLTAGAGCAQANGTSNNLFAQGGVFQTVANTLIFLVGAIAVLFLIIGGLRYVISNGDSKAVEGAKNTILYAIVGIVVAVISFALVSFVITSLQKSG